MAKAWWIAFLAMLVINQSALGYSTFDPDTTWYDGIGPSHTLDSQEKVNIKIIQASNFFVRISP